MYIQSRQLDGITTSTQLLRTLRKHKLFLTPDHQAEVPMVWDNVEDTGELLGVQTLPDDKGQLMPWIIYHQRGGIFHVFKTACAAHHPTFNVPIAHMRYGWVCAVFDKHMQFRNAMIVGSFPETFACARSAKVPALEVEYSRVLASFDSSLLAKLRSTLQNRMLDEVEAATQEHVDHVASIRGRYRNQLNYFTALFDEAQETKDVKEKASYSFSMEGYPPSKEYRSYKTVRRAHSKRNAPNVDCVITRHVNKHPPKTFARWSVEDRVWVTL